MLKICPNCKSIKNKDCDKCRQLDKKHCISRYDRCCASTITYQLKCYKGECKFGGNKEDCLCYDTFIKNPVEVRDWSGYNHIHNLVNELIENSDTAN